MAELIYNVRKVFCDYLKSQNCKYYNIPEYQRGFKWSGENVSQLLVDLKNFRKGDSDAFYCLQNITLTKAYVNGEYCLNVIDGQQRLTTLFILTAFLQSRSNIQVIETGTTILKYSVREETDASLQTEILSGKVWNSQIDSSKARTKDQYYILEVAKAIQNWFVHNELSYKTILDNLVLIVNQVDSGDEETVFASLNGGKVDLDGADLVRAILITRAAKQRYPTVVSKSTLHQMVNNDIDLGLDISFSPQGKINEYRIKLGVELDEMNLWWSQKDVRSYFEQLLPNRISQNRSFRHINYPIDLLYFSFFEAYKEKFTSVKKERDLELRFFENGMDFNGDHNDDHLEFYNALREFHYTMVDWHNNDEIFNLLGYLLYNYKSDSISFDNIWRIWQSSSSKAAFVIEIKRLIRQVMAKTFSPDDESTVEEKEAILLQAVKNPEFDWYHHDFTVKFLPVLDVLPFEETIKNKVKVLLSRVKTGYFSRVSEDKEHIRSQKRQIDENSSEEEKQALLEENRKGINSIGNVVLLVENVNRSYGNDEHTLKMDRIVNEYFLKDTYIRPHTFRVFTQKLTNLEHNGIQENVFWSDEDIARTIKEVTYRLVKFLGFSEPSTNN